MESSSGIIFELRQELRLCEVKGEIGYFHCWEHYARVVDASPMIGGHPGGQISYILGIVEFSDCVKHVDPTQIKFTDEKNSYLGALENHMKGEENNAEN